MTTKQWVMETINRYGLPMVLKEPLVCLFLTQQEIEKKMTKKNWEEEFEKQFDYNATFIDEEGRYILTNVWKGKVKDFIKDLLRSQKLELLEGLKMEEEQPYVIFGKNKDRGCFKSYERVAEEHNTKIEKLKNEL